jgi:hypothetical protein
MRLRHNLALRNPDDCPQIGLSAIGPDDVKLPPMQTAVADLARQNIGITNVNNDGGRLLRSAAAITTSRNIAYRHLLRMPEIVHKISCGWPPPAFYALVASISETAFAVPNKAGR